LKELIRLRRSPHQFLTFYLNIAGETIPRNVQERVVLALEATAEKVRDTTLKKAFRREQERLGPLIPDLRPIGQGLLLLSSEEADILQVVWLPGSVGDHLRFGRGAYALPLMDLLDELEPIGIAFVEKDKARLLAASMGRLLAAEHFEADVPGRQKAGGWSAARYERHALEHAERHLRHVAERLVTFAHEHGFRRLFLGGPTEALTMFKQHLTAEMNALVVGEVPLAAHASDADMIEGVLPYAREVERAEEKRVVEELIVRAEKGQGAVTGLAATANALNERRVFKLVLDPAVDLPGSYCRACNLLFPEEDIICPRCGGKTANRDLRGEMATHASGAEIELVHGEAASLLWGYESIGALLRPEHH
jgi:peptide subunit release factor 1 (eRF1)